MKRLAVYVALVLACVLVWLVLAYIGLRLQAAMLSWVSE